MKTTSILAAALVLLMAALAIFLVTRPKQPEIESFWDVARNPEEMPELDARQQQVAERALELTGAPERIAELVDFVVFEAQSEAEAETELGVLAALGDQPHLRALEILRDPALRQRLSQVTRQENSLPEAPIMRLCEIFDTGTPPPPEAASLLAPYLDSESERIREHAALIIGSVGTVDSLPYLHRALANDNEHVRSYALLGVQRAIEDQRIDEAAHEEFFTLIANLWPADDRCDEVAPILLKLDRQRAIPFLLDEKLLNVHFHSAWRILSALDREDVEVPRDRLLALIAEGYQEPLQHPREWLLEKALAQLGNHRDAEDLPLLERFLDYEDEDVARGAVVGLYRYHRYYARIRNPWDVVEAQGWPALTETEKYICALDELAHEVSNGGFAQYYFNSAGDHWEEAVRGLVAIGAPKRVQVMQATVQKFPTKPSTNRQLRQEQLAQLVPGQKDPFARQDTAWYDAKDENLDRLLLKYNLAHLQGREK